VWPAIALAVTAGNAVVAAQDWRPKALASFDLVWQTVNDTYHDPGFGGLNWADVRAELRPIAERAASPDEVRRVIGDMLARLGQSHFGLITGSNGGELVGGDAVAPLDIRTAADGVLVTRVEAGTTNVRPGDLIIDIDGHDVATWIATVEGRDDRDRQRLVWQRASRALHGPSGSSARLALRGPDGRERTAEVARVRPPGQLVRLGNLPPFNVRTEASAVRTAGGLRVGLIAFNVWMAAVAEPFARAVDEHRTADGIVIDLRGNPGGLAEMLRGLAGHFLPTPELLGRMHMRHVVLDFRANPRRSTSDGRTVEPFAGPLAILVDDLTASASECFAGGMQSLGRARVFGRRTMGQALPASTRELPNGDVLMYAVGDFVTSTGRRLEGAGVAPDDAVPLSRKALAAGRDEDLAAALAWIERRSKEPR
jgi:carboxyl-terminal processing protease